MGGNGVQRNYEKRHTVSINKSDLPTCAQIAKFLEDYGDKKLFSGSTDLGVVGVILGEDGCPQLALRHTNRENAMN